MDNNKTNYSRKALIICALILFQLSSFATDVVFSVDMTEYDGTFDYLTEGVTLNGNFNDWCGLCEPMADDDMDGIYEVTLDMAPGSYEFKFAIGEWSDQESLIPGTSCTLTTAGFTNRTLTVDAEGSSITPVCWNSCLACGETGGDTPQDVTFSVDMNSYTGPEDYVSLGINLNGSFNDWCGLCNPMSDDDMDGVYELTIPLVPNTFEYKFVIGEWADDEMFTPGMECVISDGTFTNRVFTLGQAPMDLGTVCWESCLACGEELDPQEVTFKVDMNEYAGAEDFAALGLNLNGTFNEWCGTCNPMSDDDMDGIYELTIELPAGAHEYKFVIGDWVDDETLAASPCTTDGEFINRTLVIGDSAIELDAVCWESCNVCGFVASLYSVTFKVDMNQYDGAEDYVTAGVNVNGTFNDWCGECWAMTDEDSDGVYEFTADVMEGPVEFKYVIGNWVEEETFDGTESCVNNPGGFWNRWIENLTEDTELQTVCWSSCDACAQEELPCVAPEALICDNLDNYPEGLLNGAAAHWSTWSGTLGGTEDGLVSSEQAFSNTKSLLIQEAASANTAQDVLLLLGDRTAGAYNLSWMEFIPAGAIGYYNVQEEETPNVGYNFTVYFNRTGETPGMGEVVIDGANPEVEYTFSYPEGEWFAVEHYFNLDGDFLVYTVNEVEVVGDYPYPGNIGSIDFFSIGNTNRYYIDDVVFDEAEIVDNIFEHAASDFTLFPNPVSELLSIKSDKEIEGIVIKNLIGQIVLNQQNLSGLNQEINLSELKTGSYLISIESNGSTSTKRIVKK